MSTIQFTFEQLSESYDLATAFKDADALGVPFADFATAWWKARQEQLASIEVTDAMRAGEYAVRDLLIEAHRQGVHYGDLAAAIDSAGGIQ
jgi:hypothetical protein